MKFQLSGNSGGLLLVSNISFLSSELTIIPSEAYETAPFFVSNLLHEEGLEF